jgi:hypothetical protein
MWRSPVVQWCFAVVAGLAIWACTQGECGPDPCGACQAGCVPVDHCSGTTWECTCQCSDAGGAQPDAGCGPSPFGACQPGCVPRDACVAGLWQCTCGAPDGGAC